MVNNHSVFTLSLLLMVLHHLIFWKCVIKYLLYLFFMFDFLLFQFLFRDGWRFIPTGGMFRSWKALTTTILNETKVRQIVHSINVNYAFPKSKQTNLSIYYHFSVVVLIISMFSLHAIYRYPCTPQIEEV